MRRAWTWSPPAGLQKEMRQAARERRRVRKAIARITARTETTTQRRRRRDRFYRRNGRHAKRAA